MNYFNLKAKVIIFSLLLIFLLPFYNYFFIGSMEVALDRHQYLYMMDYPFNGREEPLIHVLSWFLGFFINSSFIKLILIQNIFIIFLVLTFAFICNIVKYSGITKLLLLFSIFLVVYSNMLGVQLRIGYATILFLFLIFCVKIDFKINLKILYLLIPILMHFGTFFSCFFYFLYSFFKINNYKKNLVFIFILCICVLFLFKFVPLIINYMGLNAYYLDYLDVDSSLNDGRKYPFTLIFYIFILFLIFFNKSIKKIESYYFCYSGLVLIFIANALDFYVAYKFLQPISAYSLIFYMKNFNIKYDNIFYYVVILIIIFIISYYSFSNQVGLF